MINVRLYGHLGKLFGRTHSLAVKTPTEAVRALQANYSGFRAALHDKGVAGYKIIIDSKDKSSAEYLGREASQEIKLVPVLKGAGGNNSGILYIVLAVVIAVVAWYALPALFGTGGTFAGTMSAGTMGAIQSGMYQMAASLALSGISAMLYSPPDLQTATQVEQNKGYYFNGPSNLSRQGSPVPLAYGKVVAGSVTIHAAISTTEESSATITTSTGIRAVWDKLYDFMGRLTS